MYFTTILIGILPVLASAHSESGHSHAGLPKILGGRKVVEFMRTRNLLDHLAAPEAGMKMIERTIENVAEAGAEIFNRGSTGSTTTCGEDVASCATGLCCSLAGYIHLIPAF